MAGRNTTLFFQNSRKYGVGVLAFDLLLSESHNYSSTVTEHPVEDGSDITDHIENALEGGTVNGLVSNFSLKREGITTNTAQDAFELLVDLWNQKTLVTVTTVLKVYENVAITSMPFQKDSSQGESLPISVSFQKMNIVNLQTVDLELTIKVNDLEGDINKQISPQKDIGEITTTETVELSDSLLRGAVQ